jgi:hypothetical protein
MEPIRSAFPRASAVHAYLGFPSRGGSVFPVKVNYFPSDPEGIVNFWEMEVAFDQLPVVMTDALVTIYNQVYATLVVSLFELGAAIDLSNGLVAALSQVSPTLAGVTEDRYLEINVHESGLITACCKLG